MLYNTQRIKRPRKWRIPRPSAHYGSFKMTKHLQSLAAVLVALFTMFVGNADAQSQRNVEMKRVGVVEKSTRIPLLNCVGTYIYDTYAAKTNERLAVIVLPSVCGGNWTYYGDFGQEVNRIEVEDVVFHLVRVGKETFMGPINTSPALGTDVFVANTLPMDLTIGSTKFVAYPNHGFLSGRIADVTWGSKSTSSCSMSGCTQSSYTQIDGQFLIIDRNWDASTGTAVINNNYELVGIVLQASGSRTLVMSSGLLWDRLNRAGLAGKG
ncbi:MAG: hypothetical protein JWN18_764 [Parcubacteria group bacterium]|nr:hypothetical protein [Parcubacteria group bacterium]